MEPLVLFMDSLVPADVPRGYRRFCTLLVDASKLLRSGKHTYYGCAVSRLAASLHIDILHFADGCIGVAALHDPENMLMQFSYMLQACSVIVDILHFANG